MASIDSLQELLVDQLRDIYDAEKRLTKALPKLVKASTNEELSSALEHHLQETQEHVRRLEQAFEALDEAAKAKTCAGMKGIIEEGEEHVGEDYGDDGLRDAVIIASAQRSEHYEIAAYGTAIAHARLLDQDEVVDLLEQTLAEEKAADQKLTQIAESLVNLDAANAEDESKAQGASVTRMGMARGSSRAMSNRPARRGMASDRSRGNKPSSRRTRR
jgi:ferritin-like metal-binding protein YciE